MTPEHWEKVAQIHRAALQHTERERLGFLAAACGDDEELRAEVESLLAYDGNGNDFLEEPAMEMVARQLAQGHASQTHRSGTKLGYFEILEPLGAGGMGEVYRARDSRLNRDVALKFLPSIFTDDVERMARFRREAQVLASLNHPNVGSIYGLEEANGVSVLVLELVEGPTLAACIDRGAMPVPQVLAIARQVADAVAYAHERGVTHRDLKPANIKITNDGTVKVLDFGLAKFLDGPEDPKSDSSISPMFTHPITLDGLIVGTPAYMSPEQAKGLPADKRADIWAFGVILYELLTGSQLFHRDTASETLAAVLKDEPDWNRLPQGVHSLVKRCLEKDRKRRLRDLGDMHLLLETTPAPARRVPVWAAWSCVAVLLVAAAGLALLNFRQRPLAPTPVQFQIFPTGTMTYGDAFALSPDGRHLAFAAPGSDGHVQLWVRDLDSLQIRSLSDSFPVSVIRNRVVPPFFWSPDSRFIGFQAGLKLAKIAISGGPAQMLCDVDGTVVGGSWNREDVIVFAENTSGLKQVSAAGGMPTQLTRIDSLRKEVVHVLPSFLPDGKHFLYLRASSNLENSGVYVGVLNVRPEEQDLNRLLQTTSGPVYVPSSDSGSGQILFLRQGTLMAQPFDSDGLRLMGDPVRVASQVGSFIDYGFFSASNTGVLAYRSAAGQNYQLTWFDRQGKVVGTVAEPGAYNSMALSPDEKLVAVSRTNPESTANWDVWLLDLVRKTSTRLTYDQVRATFPVWSADGKSVVFGSVRGGKVQLYLRSASGSGDEQLWLKSTDADIYATSWSRDGRFVLYTGENQDTKSDLWLLPLQADRRPTPLLRTKFNESSGQFSPNGHWIAYTSDESGRDEIYVAEFSPASIAGGWKLGNKSVISNGGGSTPKWRGDGRELFFVAADGSLMSVGVETKRGFEAGTPKRLFQLPAGFLVGDISASGNRLLIGVPAAGGETTPFTVVLNWPNTFKSR